MKEVKFTIGYADNTSRTYTIGNFADDDPNVDSDTLISKVTEVNEHWIGYSYNQRFVGENSTAHDKIYSTGITALQITTTQENNIALTDYEYDDETAAAAKSTGIKVTFVGASKTQNKTYNYINPQATDAQLYILGENFASLSSDTFGGSTRVDTTKLSEPLKTTPATVNITGINQNEDLITNLIASDATVTATVSDTTIATVGTVSYDYNEDPEDPRKKAQMIITSKAAGTTTITLECSDGRTVTVPVTVTTA